MGKLWIPAGAEGNDPRDHVCRLCGTGLTRREFQSHVYKCYRSKETEIRSSSLRERAPGIMGDQGVDLEHERWWRLRGGLNGSQVGR